MNLQFASFVTLGVALAAGVVRPRGRPNAWHAAGCWQVPLACALAMAWLSGVVTPVGLVFTGLLLTAGVWHDRRPDRLGPGLILGGLALAMALHKVPGFHNLLLFDALRLSPQAQPFTLYANADKALAGLCLLVFASKPAEGASSGRALWRQVLMHAALTGGMVLWLAWSLGVVRWEPRWAVTPDWLDLAWPFLLVNLFFTCVAEEAFFRGLVQGGAQRWLQYRGLPVWPAVAAGAVLFGLAHLGGGAVYAGLAMLAGAGYGLVRWRTGRVGAAIAVHFSLNAAHFLFFTYPRLA